MNARNISKTLSLSIYIVFTVVTVPLAQVARIPVRLEVYPLTSGVHENLSAKEHVTAFREVVTVSGAPYLRLHFGEYNLGEESFITVTSLRDSNSQRLNSISMVHYRSSSAYFNGDAVELELHVAPGEKGIFIDMKEVTVGEKSSGSLETLHLCGADNRASSTDPAVGRIIWRNLPYSYECYGTGWIASNGALLTAGHVYPYMELLEFNVPPSLCNGIIQHPDPDNQYPVNLSSAVWSVDSDCTDCPGVDCGNDWAVFSCFPNSDTGLLPVQAQQSYYRMSRDDSAIYVIITGYGIDMTPLGCDEGPNEDSNTQQTDFGDFLGEHFEDDSDIVLEYEVDTMNGNSGSPVIVLGTVRAIGIHTDGGCNRPNTGNFGTSFEHDGLEAALQTFHGTNVVHVDYYQFTTGDGTVFRPFATVFDAYKAAPSGGIISIVKGAYNETFTITRPMKLIAPVGPVFIGQ